MMFRNIAYKRFLHSSLRYNTYRNIQCAFTIPQYNEKKGNRIDYLKYLLYFTSGCIIYKILQQKNSTIVHNAVGFSTGGTKLVGRRKQFNFIADVVETSAPSVVYIEIKDTRNFDFFSVTNKPHSKVEVRLHNGTVYNGVVEDVDMQSDLATVRINAKNLPIIPLGNSSDLRPGEFVVAIGSPLSLSNTVTAGVVSSTQRGSDEIGLKGKDMVYIQTDAAITFGNSGGPLVNLDGEAIGVNSMKVTAGISFAIPIDYVKEFLNNARGESKVPIEGAKRRYVGITMLTLTPEILSELRQRNQPVPNNIKYGVLVWKVMYGSPAHLGGLQPGDIVTRINDKDIASAADVYNILGDKSIRNLKITLIRLGKELEIKVVPEDIN
ncbi:hypothetical protein Trydic_g15001 [Trypoxylus dichotomus]